MTEQNNNRVGRDQAGRDIIHNIYNSNAPLLSGLIKKYELERQENILFNSMVEKLEHFSVNIDSEFVGLEKKLYAGSFGDYYNHANVLKEYFTKRLIKLQLYESAQKILVFILADIFSRYHNNVYPLILKDSPQEDVFKAIQDEIIDPVTRKFEGCLVSLEIYADEINGALFFLTGNCHLKWE